MPKKQPKLPIDRTDQTFTYKQVEDLMCYAIREYLKNIELAMEGLYESEEFHAEAIERKYTPLNWLYYAVDDTVRRSMLATIAAWEEFDRREGLENSAQKIADLLDPDRKAELIGKQMFDPKHPQTKESMAKLKEMLRRSNKGDKK